MLDAAKIDWSLLTAPDGAYSALVHLGSTPDEVCRRCSGLAYLSTPYAEGACIGGSWRFEKSVEMETRAAMAMHRLARLGVAVLSPAVQWAAMAHAAMALPRDQRISPLDAGAWDIWAAPLRNAAGLIVVPDVPGWQRSRSVWGDVIWALDHATPVHFMAV